MARQPTRSKRPAPRKRQRGSGARQESTSKATAGKGQANTTRKTAPSSPRSSQQPLSDDLLRDAWGVILLVLAALSALGLFAEGSAGVVGTFLSGLERGLFGIFALGAPLALIGGGILLLRESQPTNRQRVMGALLGFVALTGLWHLGGGAPGFDAGTLKLGRVAGWLGAVTALSLKAVAATAGAVVLLGALLVVGALMATSTPPRVLIQAVVGTFVRTGIRDGVSPQQRQPGTEAPREEPSPAPVDEDPDTDELPAPTTPVPELTDTQLLPRGVDTSAPGPGPAHRLSPPAVRGDYQLPPPDLLRIGRVAVGNLRNLKEMEKALERMLSQFSVNAKVSQAQRGPTVTRFEIELGQGVRVSAVTRLEPDIAYALKTPEIRIVSPIPGKSAIGIEVPNRDRDLVALGDVLRSAEASAQHHPLAVGLGIDIAKNDVMVNLAAMPHLLIAGATGSGKSVTMNGIVASILMRATPAQVRMILIDPKRVELNHYDGAPHLLTPVVTDPRRATEALDWVVKEMEHRYERLALLGYRNIDTYNAAVRDGSVRRAPALSGQADAQWDELPYVLCIIDELADLMMVAPRDVESTIVRIAQMARAVGIHLIVATQRPSVDVVTGLIKANIPSRIALAMATQADSRTILDQGGAEKLVGHGDMLFLPANANKPQRIQGCYVDESEIEQVVGWCKAQREAEYAPGVVREGDDALRADVAGEDADDEALTRAAMDLVVRSGLGSTSMLQRKLKIGFARAGRLMDELEQMGVVGPSEGPKARQVLITVEELTDRLSQER
jgi:DNA segregation ATPase FtsK/SpoIIIE, S-DNA-T family